MAATAVSGRDEEEGLPIIGEKESTTTTTKPSEESAAGAICFCLVVLVLAIVGFVHLSIGAVHLLRGGPYDPVEYTVAIAAVSGLDVPAKDGLLSPAFNLTLRAASPRTAEGRECVTPGTAVEVSYPRPASGVPLAAGAAPAFCVGVGERREEGSVIAWGDGVRLPGLVMDSLAKDVQRGAPEFGVKLTPLPDCDGVGSGRFCADTVDVISCWAKVGGGFSAPCSVSKERALFPPVQRPGARDSAANLPQPTP